MEGWVKLYRQLLNWEWYSDIKVTRLFVHILLKANFKSKNWRGILIEEGSFATSIKSLSIETGLTTQQIRTSLNKLKKTKEITTTSTNSYTIIKVVNYRLFQNINLEENSKNKKEITNKKQSDKTKITNTYKTKNKKTTTTKECKELNNEKNEKNEKNENNILIASKKPEKIKYADFVSLTIKEYNLLIKNIGYEKTKTCIEILDNYKGAHDKTYASDYRAILSWVIEKVDKEESKKSSFFDIAKELSDNEEEIIF